MKKTAYPSQTLDKFIVRFPPGMRDRIAQAADAAGRTMNAEVIARLEETFFDDALLEGKHAVADVAKDPLVMGLFISDAAIYGEIEKKVDKTPADINRLNTIKRKWKGVPKWEPENASQHVPLAVSASPEEQVGAMTYGLGIREMILTIQDRITQLHALSKPTADQKLKLKMLEVALENARRTQDVLIDQFISGFSTEPSTAPWMQDGRKPIPMPKAKPSKPRR